MIEETKVTSQVRISPPDCHFEDSMAFIINSDHSVSCRVETTDTPQKLVYIDFDKSDVLDFVTRVKFILEQDLQKH